MCDCVSMHRIPIRTTSYSFSFAHSTRISDGGASFGELALISKDCIRNASIIADCRTDLIVVNRATYNRSLREVHLAEFRKRNEFVDSCPVFNGWIRSLKRQAAMSLTQVQLPYNTLMIRQGDPVNGLMFLLKWVVYFYPKLPIRETASIQYGIYELLLGAIKCIVQCLVTTV